MKTAGLVWLLSRGLGVGCGVCSSSSLRFRRRSAVAAAGWRSLFVGCGGRLLRRRRVFRCWPVGQGGRAPERPGTPPPRHWRTPQRDNTPPSTQRPRGATDTISGEEALLRAAPPSLASLSGLVGAVLCAVAASETGPPTARLLCARRKAPPRHRLKLLSPRFSPGA